jgi:hypothetical protein
MFQAPRMMQRVPAPLREDYLECLVDASRTFADERTVHAGRLFWCDHTPLNLRCAGDLALLFDDALFVLVLRHYRGNVQSLRRSFAHGYRWAGAHVADSAAVWSSFYQHVGDLPKSRTLVVSYDRLCYDPEQNISRIEAEVSQRVGIDPAGFDRSVLSVSHATSDARPTVGTLGTQGTILRPISSYDAAAWNDGFEAACRPELAEVDEMLAAMYPEYTESLTAETSS